MTPLTPCPNYTRRDKIPATASVSVHTRRDATVRCHTFRTACEPMVWAVSLWKRTVGPH